VNNHSALDALVCGYASVVRARKTLVMMKCETITTDSTHQAYVDESGGPGAGHILLLSACILEYPAWVSFSDDWDRALRAEPAITHFHTREARNRQGDFARWKAIDVDKKVISLTEVILRHNPHVFTCWVSEEDHAVTVEANGVPDVRHAYFTCFMTILYKVAEYQAHRGITTPADFIFDEKGDIGLEALLWYSFIKKIARPGVQKLMGATPIFRNDEQILPLQAADLVAWHKRRQKEFGVNNPETAATMRINELPGGESHITREALELMASRIAELPGMAEARSKPSYYKQLKQEARKNMRRKAAGLTPEVSAELELFNATMDTILRADPAKVKAEMEEDKRQRTEQRKAKKLPSASDHASNGKG